MREDLLGESFDPQDPVLINLNISAAKIASDGSAAAVAGVSKSAKVARVLCASRPGVSVSGLEENAILICADLAERSKPE